MWTVRPPKCGVSYRAEPNSTTTHRPHGVGSNGRAHRVRLERAGHRSDESGSNAWSRTIPPVRKSHRRSTRQPSTGPTTAATADRIFAPSQTQASDRSRRRTSAPRSHPHPSRCPDRRPHPGPRRARLLRSSRLAPRPPRLRGWIRATTSARRSRSRCRRSRLPGTGRRRLPVRTATGPSWSARRPIYQLVHNSPRRVRRTSVRPRPSAMSAIPVRTPPGAALPNGVQAAGTQRARQRTRVMDVRTTQPPTSGHRTTGRSSRTLVSTPAPSSRPPSTAQPTHRARTSRPLSSTHHRSQHHSSKYLSSQPPSSHRSSTTHLSSRHLSTTCRSRCRPSRCLSRRWQHR